MPHLHAERNRQICEQYQRTGRITETARMFNLGRQRVTQIIKRAGVWKPRTRGPRIAYVGVNVSEEAKQALRDAASAHGMSISQYTAQVIDDVVATPRKKR